MSLKLFLLCFMAVSVNFYCNVGALASSFTLSSAECRRFLTTVSTKHAQTSFAAISVFLTSIFPASRATRKTSFLCCSFLTSGEQSSGRTTLRDVCCYDIINRLQSTPEMPEHFTKWCGSRLRLKKALRRGNRVGVCSSSAEYGHWGAVCKLYTGIRIAFCPESHNWASFCKLWALC